MADGDMLEETEQQLQQELERIRKMRQNPEENDEAPARGREAADGVWEMTTRAAEEKDPYVFRLDGEELKAARRMPAGFAMDMVESRASMSHLDQMGKFRIMLEMLESILWPESMDVIRARLRNPKNPIELDDLAAIINHLSTVVYGRKRPTQQSSDLSSVRPTTGTGSTDGAQPKESTPDVSETTPSTSTPSTTG